LNRTNIAGIEITGLTADSRQVQPGFLFAALPGSRADGRDYIGDAVRRGAVALLTAGNAAEGIDAETVDGRPLAILHDDNPHRHFAQMAARFFGRQPATVAAVTGTNGKTSVVWFLRQIWAALGHAAASLGTLGVSAPGFVRAGSLTTPDPVSLHRTLSELTDQQVQRLAMEASSHGLHQYRLDGVRIAAAAFTNLSRDHLDYHGTMEAYLSAKLRLFAELVEVGGGAVICADDLHAERVRRVAEGHRLRVITYGSAGQDLRINAAVPESDGQRLMLTIEDKPMQVLLPLVGDFQARNALAAAGLAIATGGEADAVISALADLKPVPGRLERVARVAGAPVYVDYAHTPDALAVTLSALRSQAARQLVVLFGCGGDRDPGKRPEMGRIAATLADQALISDDNPRTEDPASIRRAILEACPGAKEIGDRREAIFHAVSALRPGDVLLVAGKGHETGQIVGTTVLPFDDAAVVRDAVRELRR
jgi:UDP-N-acetylmuramoyl-L-alanyl-D-glutamate--2,6-diaminopimelate ligase